MTERTAEEWAEWTQRVKKGLLAIAEAPPLDQRATDACAVYDELSAFLREQESKLKTVAVNYALFPCKKCGHLQMAFATCCECGYDPIRGKD